jgi:hypothetical protein
MTTNIVLAGNCSFWKTSLSLPESLPCRADEGYRIRIGNYRVLYELDEPLRTVIVTSIGHRRDVYH